MRYRLRTLLLVMFGVAVATGSITGMWRAWQAAIRDAERQRIDRERAEAAARPARERRQREEDWERAKQKSKELGAPQPIALP